MMTSLHPMGMAGDVQGKGANVSWAFTKVISKAKQNKTFFVYDDDVVLFCAFFCGLQYMR
jgi:hypothetical protein